MTFIVQTCRDKKINEQQKRKIHFDTAVDNHKKKKAVLEKRRGFVRE